MLHDFGGIGASPVRVTGEDGVKRRVAGAEEVGIELAPEEAEDGGQETAVEQGNLRREIDRLHIVNPRYPDKPQAAPESMKETLRLALQHDTPADIARARAVAPSVAERALASGIAAIRKAWRLE